MGRKALRTLPGACRGILGLACIVLLLCGCADPADETGFSAFIVRGRSHTGRPATLLGAEGKVRLEVGASSSSVSLNLQTVEDHPDLGSLVGKTVAVESGGVVRVPVADYPKLRITGGVLTVQALAEGFARGNYDLETAVETSEGTAGAPVKVVGSFTARVPAQ